MLQSSIRRRTGPSGTRLNDISPSSERNKKKEWYVYPLCGLAMVLLMMVLYVALFSGYGIMSKSVTRPHVLRSTGGNNDNDNNNIINNNNNNEQVVGRNSELLTGKRIVEAMQRKDRDYDNGNSNDNNNNNNNNNRDDDNDSDNDSNDRRDSNDDNEEDEEGASPDSQRERRVRREESWKAKFGEDPNIAERFKKKMKGRDRVKHGKARRDRNREEEEVEEEEEDRRRHRYNRNNIRNDAPEEEERRGGHDANALNNDARYKIRPPRHDRDARFNDIEDDLLRLNRDEPPEAWKARLGRDGVLPRRPPPEGFEDRLRARREGRPFFDGRSEGGHINGNSGNPPMPCRDRGAPILCERILEMGECDTKRDICAKTCGFCRDNAEHEDMGIPEHVQQGPQI